MSKITLDISKLREALNACGVVVPYRTSLPITSNVLMKAIDGRLVFKTTNLESGVVVSLPCDEHGLFYACVSYRSLAKFVAKGDGKISLDDSNKKKLVVERPKFGMVMLQSEDVTAFPPISEDKVEYKTMGAKEFCRMLGIVMNGCVKKDDTRPVLTAVCFKDGAIAAVDGFRLYVYKNEKMDFGLGENKEALLPFRTAQQIIKLFGKKDKLEVGFVGEGSTLSPNKPPFYRAVKVCFKSGETHLVSQLVQGSFPRYEQLIPTDDGGMTVSISAPLMMERLSCINESDIYNGVIRLTFMDADHQQVCVLGARGDAEEGASEYEMDMPVKIKTPQYNKIALQIKYLKDVMKYFSLCDMTIYNPSSPALFKGDIEGLTVVVMPLFVVW